MKSSLLLISAISVFAACLRAQSNYEIQVYGADTVPPGSTMVELHSNFTAYGFRRPDGTVVPDNHAEHETVEITQGMNDWSEVGFYFFTSEGAGQGAQWVGDHIRPRVRVPEKWRWPVGVSLSTEFGYQRAKFAPDTWDLGDSADCRQDGGAMVLRRQSSAWSVRGTGRM